MNIKILETKLQTIFENDSFAVTEKNIKERILIELDFILQRIAEYYETIEMIATIKLGAREHIKDEKYDLENLGEIIIKCDNILDMLKNESIYYKEKLINFTEEIFINQDLYDLLKKDMPSISKLLDKLILENSNSSLDNFLNWFDNESNYIKIANLANGDAYQYINKLCYEYCEILKPYQKLKLVKNETGGVNDERTGSN